MYLGKSSIAKSTTDPSNSNTMTTKKVIELDFEEKVELPAASFPPFKLRSSMVDTDPVIWVHLIEVYIQYIQAMIQLTRPITERSEEQLCQFVRSYLREIADEQGQILSLGLINPQITGNLDVLKAWVLELVKQFGVIRLKLNGAILWDFARIYARKHCEITRGIISGTYKPKSNRTISSILGLQRHIEHLVTNGKFSKLDLQILAILLNEKGSIEQSKKPDSTTRGKSLNSTTQNGVKKQSAFTEDFVSIQWLEVLEKLYSGGKGHFASICKDLGVLSLVYCSTNKVATMATEMGISSYRALSLYPLFGAIITSAAFKKIHTVLSQKLPFLSIAPRTKSPVNQDDVRTLIELFPSLTIEHTEKLLKKNSHDVESLTHMLLENPELCVPKEKSAPRHVYESGDIEFISQKRVVSKPTTHVPDEHKNKTLAAALRLMYEADEDERDDTYDEAEATAMTTEPSKVDKIEMYLWDLFKKDQVFFDKGARKSKQRKEMKNETGWFDEQIEGWAKMIQRSPKRAKILEEKYLFKGNKPWKSSFFKDEAHHNVDGARNDLQKEEKHIGSSQTERKQPKVGYDISTKNQHAKNEKNKASRANHNRKSGHDRKIAKGY